jgi:hypothetical protein
MVLFQSVLIALPKYTNRASKIRLSQYQFGSQLAADGVAQDIDRATKRTRHHQESSRTRHDDQESSRDFISLFDAASSLLQGVESERRAAYGIGNPSQRTTQRPLVPPLQSQSYKSSKTTTAPVLASPLTGSTQKGRLSLGLDRTNLTSSNGSQADSGRITPSVDVDGASILMKRRTTGSTLKSLNVQILPERTIGQIIASNSPLHSATPSSNQIHFSGPNIRCAEVSRSNSVVALPPCRPRRDSLEARRIAIEKANFSSVSRASTSSGIPGSASANQPSPQLGSYFFKPLSTTSTAKSNHISPVGLVLPTPALTGTLPSFEEYHRQINLQRQSAQPQPQTQPLPQSHRPSQHQDPHGRPLAHYPGQTPHVIPRAIDQKAAFLSLFSTFYDSLTDSRVLTRTLEDQIRRGDVLIRDLEMGQRDLARMRREFEEDRAKFIQQSSRSE